jgi:AcrR family transcriptional regulator
MGSDGDASHDASQRAQFSDDRVARMQRARILDAVVEVVAERGVAGASVRLVIARAKVSSRTFYECFAGSDECLVAVLDGALARATPLVVRAFAQEDSWQNGMRRALAAMLAFFDEEPALTRVCLVEMGTASPVVREHRERILEAFRALVLARIQSDVSHPSPLAPEGVLGSVISIVNARLIAPERAPLIELLGPLMGIIVGPFMDKGDVEREIERGNDLAHKIQAEHAWSRSQLPPDGPDLERLTAEIPALLRNSKAKRARLCLVYLAEQGRQGLSPNNREIAAAVGIAHKGQMSKLLARLEGAGIVSKISHGAGRPNAWKLTPYGREIAAHFELQGRD